MAPFLGHPVCMYSVLGFNYQSVYGTVIILLFGLLVAFTNGISINTCGYFAKIFLQKLLHFAFQGALRMSLRSEAGSWFQK